MMRPFTFFCLALGSGSLAGAATIQVFTNYQQWAAALNAAQPAATVVTENFDSGGIDTPGLSVATYSGMGGVQAPGDGRIVNGQWSDTVGKNAPLAYDTTVFSYTGNLYGLGGDWNIQPSATGLELWANTASDPFAAIVPDPPGDFGAAGYQGWWGFISDQPFTAVTLGSDVGATTYTLDNLALADPPVPAPEPRSDALLLIGTLGLLAVARRRWFGRVVKLTHGCYWLGNLFPTWRGNWSSASVRRFLKPRIPPSPRI